MTTVTLMKETDPFVAPDVLLKDGGCWVSYHHSWTTAYHAVVP